MGFSHQTTHPASSHTRIVLVPAHNCYHFDNIYVAVIMKID